MRLKTKFTNRFLAAALTIAALAAGHTTAWAQETTYTIKKTFFSGLNYSPEPASSDDDNFYYAAGTVITLTPTDAHKIIVSVSPSGTLNAVIASNKRSATITMPAQNVTSGSVTQHEVYKVTLPEGISLSGSGSNAKVYTLDGETYCRYDNAYTWYTIVAPFGYVLNSATYDGAAATTSSSGNIGFYIKKKDAVVTAEATDCFGIENGADGTSEHPYVITAADGLTLLTKYTSDKTSGKYFELGDDIAYSYTTAWNANSSTENNFNGIASFGGTFDGKGHTISGIRICQNGTYHGLFNKITGTVKNVVLSDVRVTGYDYIGALTGEIDGGAVQNCLVLCATVTCKNDAMYTSGGVIAGEYSNDGGCSNNFYRGCTVNGSSTNIGAYHGDRAWACGGYTIALPDGVSAESGKSLTTVGGVTYHGSYENTVTLTYDNVPAGKAALFTVTYADGSGLVAETTGAFTMPEADVSVSAELYDLYTLALPDGVSADGHSVTVGSDTYYLGGTTVALSYPTLSEGYAAVYSVNGSTIAGNTFDITANTTVTVAITDVWGIAGGADGTSEATAYVITTAAGLDLLANKVDGMGGYSENDYSGKYFKLGDDIAYSHTTAWNAAASTEDNFKPIGNAYYFNGTFDGDGHTVSGIRIYRGGNRQYSDDGYLGLFGKVSDGGTVKNVTVSDARITGFWYVGGVVGGNYGTVQNCHAAATVAVHAVREDAEYHGGVVGYNFSGTVVSGCTSAATLSMADGLNICGEFGGVVGYSYNSTIENCLALGATVSGTDDVGAIVGNFGVGTLTNNYYNGCTVNCNTSNVGCGWYYSQFGSDSGDITGNDGAVPGYLITLGTGVTSDALTVGTYNVAPSGATITLSASDGYAIVSVSYNDGTDHSITPTNDVYTFTMPAENVTVTATWKKPLTNTDITITIPSQEYTGSVLTPVISITDGLTPLTETDYTVTLPEGGCTNAGQYEVTITGIGNYDGTEYKTFTIEPKDLTVTANNHTINYGDEPENDGVTYSGFVEGESASLLNGELTYTYKTATDDTGEDYTASSAEGTYYIIPGGLTSTNYNITFAAGTLTVVHSATLFAANSTNLWATFCDTYVRTIPEGCTAYTISSISGTTVTLSDALTTTIPAYTPVLVKRESGELSQDIKPKYSADGTVPDNYNSTTGIVTSAGTGFTFYGNAGTDAISATDLDGYVFAYGNTEGKQSYILHSGDFIIVDEIANTGIAAHRCWLTIGSSTSNARILTIATDDESTGITTTDYTDFTDDFSAWYSLDGRKLDGKPTKKGLYIQGGHKVVVK